MKQTTILITLLLIMGILILTAGCTDANNKSATTCNSCCCSGESTKTSYITLYKNEESLTHPSTDGTKLHVIDSEGISYNTILIAKIMTDLDQYDGHNITFTYRCSDEDYYQITRIIQDHTVHKNCPEYCPQPTQTPTKCCCESPCCKEKTS